MPIAIPGGALSEASADRAVNSAVSPVLHVNADASKSNQDPWEQWPQADGASHLLTSGNPAAVATPWDTDTLNPVFASSLVPKGSTSWRSVEGMSSRPPDIVGRLCSKIAKMQSAIDTLTQAHSEQVSATLRIEKQLRISPRVVDLDDVEMFMASPLSSPCKDSELVTWADLDKVRDELNANFVELQRKVLQSDVHPVKPSIEGEDLGNEEKDEEKPYAGIANEHQEPGARASTQDAVELQTRNQGPESSTPPEIMDSRRPSLVKKLEHGNVADQCKYELSQSTWDAAIWLFTPVLGGRGSSIFMLLLVAVNVSIQSFLVLTVILNFTSQEYGEPEIAGLDIWRLRIAHDVFQMNEFYPVSAASRVCGQDVSASTSADQLGRAGDLKSYFDQSIANGVGLCMAAIVLHWVLIMQEIVQAWDLCRACAQLPHHRLTEFSLIPDGYEVYSINPSRFGFVVLIAIVRQVIAAMIMIVGTMWLAHTVEITDLLLNSVALAFIMDIDELLYTTFAPFRAKSNLNAVQPLKVTRFGEWRGLDIRSLVLLFLVILGTTTIGLFYVSPLVESLRDADKHLCGGNTDFVYGVDPLGMTHVFPTNTIAEVADELDLDSPVLRGVREAIDEVAYDDLQFAFRAPNLDFFWHTRNMGREHFADYVNINLDCKDMLVDVDFGTNQYVYMNYMRHWTNNPILHSCESLRQYCIGIDEIGGSLHFMTRLLCPITCGCANWQNGTMLAGKVYGCPSRCKLQMKKELKAQEDYNCWETDIKELRENGFFDTWLAEYASVRPGSKQLFNMTATNFKTDVCHGQGQWSNFKPLAGLFPLSCDCTGVFGDPNRSFCPGRCAYRECKTVNECFDEYKSTKLINATQPQSIHPDICLAMQNFLHCLDLISERCPPEVQKKEAYWTDKRKTYDMKEDMFYWMGQFGLNCSEILGFEEHPEFHERVWEGWADSDWTDAWQSRKKGKVETFVPHVGRGPDYCATEVLSDSGSAGMAECESRCAADTSCEFFSVWAGGNKRCVTSRACNVLKQEDHSIVIYKKLPETAEWTELREWGLQASTSSPNHPVWKIKIPHGSWLSGQEGSGSLYTKQWIKLTASSTVVLSGFRVKSFEESRGMHSFNNFKFQCSKDGSSWTDVKVGIGERQPCCDWQEITFPKWAARYWRLYMEDNHGHRRGGTQRVMIKQMEVLQEPEEGIWRQYGNDNRICNEKWQVTSSWVDCKRLAEAAGNNYFWFVTYAASKRCGTGTSCSPVTSTMLDWRIYKQQACPLGYAQLFTVGDDIPGWGMSREYNRAASLDDCKSECNKREDCGAFEWRGHYRYCALHSWDAATQETQTWKSKGTLTCAKQ